jgi:KDO2-lipid IV(A) lauroyltransferase
MFASPRPCVSSPLPRVFALIPALHPAILFNMLRYKLSFILILLVTWPVRCLPYRAIHGLGTWLGTLAYHGIPKFRKRALSNLALATSLKLSEEEIRRFAKASLQNLMITCLEYAKFDSEKRIDRVATCVNPEEANRLMEGKKPVIFFCGHQSNWEILFLEGTSRMPGVAIGRPIKNTDLYRWILGVREKFGGTMIAPQNAIREGLRGLKRGCFLGIVGDQGMPDSGYSSLFFGRRAWTSPIAAILSHRTGTPILVATTRRKEGKYFIHYSEPIFPRPDAKAEEEIDRLMQASLQELEKSIQESPGEWLWSHNRWKQQTPERLRKAFRHESILVILPKEKEVLEQILPELSTFREIYPHEFLSVYAPKERVADVVLEGAEVLPYEDEADLLKRDFRFKLVFNLTKFKRVGPHYKKLAAFHVVSLKELQALPFSTTLKKAALKDAS